MYRSDRTGYRNEVVLGGAQWRVKIDSVSERIRCQKEIKKVGLVSKVIRNMNRVLDQLI